jgi:hypothetical protein
MPVEKSFIPFIQIKIMRLLLSLLGAVFLTVPVFGQNYLTIQQKDGQEFSFRFEDKPVITYTATDLLLKTAKTDVQYPLETLSKLTFTVDATGVNAVNDDIRKPTYFMNDYEISITDAKAGSTVSVIAPDGKVIGTYKTDPDGNVTISIEDLPAGLFFINSENLTFKVLKK